MKYVANKVDRFKVIMTQQPVQKQTFSRAQNTQNKKTEQSFRNNFFVCFVSFFINCLY